MTYRTRRSTTTIHSITCSTNHSATAGRRALGARSGTALLGRTLGARSWAAFWERAREPRAERPQGACYD